MLNGAENFKGFTRSWTNKKGAARSLDQVKMRATDCPGGRETASEATRLING